MLALLEFSVGIGVKMVGLPRLELGACPYVLRAESEALSARFYC